MRWLIVRVNVRTKSDDLATAAAFHIGNGYLATARHVLEDNEIVELVASHYAESPKRIGKIFLHKDPNVDLAIIETDFLLNHYMTKVTIHEGGKERPKTDYIPLGGHLDDWIGEEFVLSRVMVLGFPPVPKTKFLVPVAVQAEVNAIVDRYDAPHSHFLISAVPRGGFSGGPVFSEYGFLLGVMTSSLHESDQSYELGFAAAVSIEPLLVMVDQFGIECGENTKFVKELFGR